MPAFCAVIRCSNRAERDKVRFFRIPRVLQGRGERLDALSKERRDGWIRSLKRGDLSETFLNNARICERHFVNGEPAKLEDKDNPDWIPSVNMGYTSIKSQDEESARRHSRAVARQTKRLKIDEASTSSAALTAAAPELISVESDLISYEEAQNQGKQDGRHDVSIQTDIDMKHLEKLFEDLTFSNERIFELNKVVKATDLSEDTFINNDTKTLYFTGIPTYQMMSRIFQTVSPYFSGKSALPPFKQFLLTLMKLRLNFPFKYLAYVFAISPTTASDTFYRGIHILYEKLKKNIHWPERETLMKSIPACFRENFGNRIAVIIDCFEIFTETPSGLLKTAQMWSNYKHHETIKFLIGITLQGTISYISEGWGGRTSDKHLTENCGILNLILPGDVILADRGFLISDSVKMLGAELLIPAFTRGKSQLEPLDVETTRKVANVRIHVERLIGMLRRKFKICQGTLPINMLSAYSGEKSALDKILVVCSALINLCNAIVPMV